MTHGSAPEREYPWHCWRKTWWRLHAKGMRDEQRGLIGMAAAVASLTGKLQARGR
jgi:hypothetical protein